MALRFVCVLLLSVYVFGFGSASPAISTQCGPNAKFVKCGSACVPTCAKPIPGPVCTLQCVIGCFCNEGFMKNSKGECVRAEECDVHPDPIPIANMEEKCGANAEFNPCGSACHPTCANPIPSPVCTKNCVIGCFCKEGFLKNTNGDCVPTRECDPTPIAASAIVNPLEKQCSELEVFNPCGSACHPTCDNPHPSPVCTKNCVIGCFCKAGLLRHSNGDCVPAHQCPAAIMTQQIPAQQMLLPPVPQCQENEEFRACRACDGSCSNRLTICDRMCRPGCSCKQGHMRNDDGKCVPAHLCAQASPVMAMMPEAPKCPANEVFKTCGSACPATCASAGNQRWCTRQCMAGCFCEEGLLRNDKGVCVATKECQKTTGGPINIPLIKDDPITKPLLPYFGPGPVIIDHDLSLMAKFPPGGHGPVKRCQDEREMFHECGVQLDCLAKCHVKFTPICMHKMCQPGCVCMQPYVRDDSGRCVETKECPNTKPF
jgi:hypothetical protein